MEKMRTAHFIDGWMDMKPSVPVPIIDWIEDKQLEIPYGDDPKQKLDFYRPAKKGLLPLIVIVHGGGFSRMDKRDWHLYPGFFALREGFAVASINYRLAPAHPFPAAIEDMKSALVFLNSHAAEYGIDSNNIFLYGTSAGGNLVSIVGLDTVGHGPNDRKIPIRAVAALCPVSNITALWEEYKSRPVFSLMRIVVRDMVKQYLRTTPDKDRKLSDDASVDPYITSSAPPFYLQHGNADPLIPYEQSLIFRDLLRETGKLSDDDLILDILDGAGHAGGGPDFFEEENIMSIINFFKRHIQIGSSL